MSSIEAGLYNLGRLDQLARQDTAVHRLDPRAKVVTTFVYLVCVVSFSKYDVLALLPFVIFPVVLASEGGLPFGFLGKRLLAVAPFALMVGAFNPLLDREAVAQIGGLSLSGGWVSYASIILRFLLTVSAALVLIGTTGLNGICMAIEKLGVPKVFATQLLLLYRYIFVLADEAMRMSRARSLRAQGRRGMGLGVYGQILGHLLLRTFARAQRIYQAMVCRGFDGTVRVSGRLHMRASDVAFMLGWSAFFALARAYDLPLLLGELVTGGSS